MKTFSGPFSQNTETIYVPPDFTKPTNINMCQVCRLDVERNICTVNKSFADKPHGGI